MMKKILVIDDQPGIRLLLTDILTTAGYSVDTADDGKEAVDLLSAHPYGLVILDYNIPIWDGEDVLNQMQDLNLTTPVIVMTGLIEKVEEKLEAQPNVKKILAKPFNVQEIPSLVKQFIVSTSQDPT
jgi:DNA-binding response OmpR family regulator